MVISDQQHEILTEIINIGLGRVASALSELSGQRVLLEVPSISFYPTAELGPAFAGMIPGEIVAVHQDVVGCLEGHALLVLSSASAALLSDLMANPHPRPGGLDDSDREVLTEVGNILLNTFVGTMCNMISSRAMLSVPCMYLEDADSLVRSMGVESNVYALVVTTTFCLQTLLVSGYMVIAFNVASLETLIHAIEAFK